MIRTAAGDRVAPFCAHVDATFARWAVDVAVEKVFLLDGWRRCAASRAAHGAAVRRPRLQSALRTYPLPRAHAWVDAWVKSVCSLPDAAEGKTLNIDCPCLQAGVSLGEGRFALESHLAIAVLLQAREQAAQVDFGAEIARVYHREVE